MSVTEFLTRLVLADRAASDITDWPTSLYVTYRPCLGVIGPQYITYRPRLGHKTPVHHLQAAPGSFEHACTDLDEYTDTVTAYVRFCVESVVHPHSDSLCLR